MDESIFMKSASTNHSLLISDSFTFYGSLISFICFLRNSYIHTNTAVHLSDQIFESAWKLVSHVVALVG